MDEMIAIIKMFAGNFAPVALLFAKDKHYQLHKTQRCFHF